MCYYISYYHKGYCGHYSEKIPFICYAAMQKSGVYDPRSHYIGDCQKDRDIKGCIKVDIRERTRICDRYTKSMSRT